MPQPRSQTEGHEAREIVAPEIVVFTGDIVGSSRLTPGERAEAVQVLGAASRDVARLRGTGLGARFSSFRGDGWQCLGPEPAYALRGALILRARLGSLGRAFDTRVSVGIGAGRLTEDDDLALASGPAFELSGHGLDDMPHARRFAVAWEDPPGGAPLLRAVFALADEISRNWTPGQARVFARLLVEKRRPSQEALARDLDITQQTVAEHLAGGGDWALQEALEAVEGGA